jgi:hypothetical protein
MARIFHAVVDGDPLTSGGHLVVPPHGDTIQDDEGRNRYVAYIGHRAWCAKCKTMGTIIGGAGISENMRTYNQALGGLMQAVSGDRVACGCKERPRIIARYATCFSFIEEGYAKRSDELAGVAPVDRAAPWSHSTNDARDYDEQVRATGQGATDGYPYFIETTDGRTESGRLDRRALLSRISTIAVEEYTIYWGDEALAKQAGV